MLVFVVLFSADSLSRICTGKETNDCGRASEILYGDGSLHTSLVLRVENHLQPITAVTLDCLRLLETCPQTGLVEVLFRVD